MIIAADTPVLVTGANGFIGARVVEVLLRHGLQNIRCFVRPTSNTSQLLSLQRVADAQLHLVEGNLLSPKDCQEAVQGVAVIYHLAAGIEKTFPGCFLNSVVTTRNLLEAAGLTGSLKRFVNVSSFSVYSNMHIRRGGLLDENCRIEEHFMERYEAYCFGKVKQDEIVMRYGRECGMPYVIVRPGAVYGPGKGEITSRVGIGTFGIFMHLGGSNRLPLTYVDNCAEAIVLAGLKEGVDGQVFNVVDDDLPTSRQFLRMYKRQARGFRSVYVPYRLFLLLNWCWERYSMWSKGQLPPVFNVRKCAAYWKGNRYSNAKLKMLLGWKPRVSFKQAAECYFESIRERAERC